MTRRRSIFLDALTRGPAELDELIEDVQRRQAQIRRDRDLTPEGRDARLRELSAEAHQRLEALTADIAENREHAVKAAARARQRTPAPETALVDELARARAWDRARQLLDAGTEPGELIERAEQAGDTATLRALRSELPGWLEVQAATAVRPAARPGARAGARRRAEVLLDAVDRAELPHLSGEEREGLEAGLAVKALDAAARSRQRLALSVIDGHYNPARRLEAAYASADADRALGSSGAGGADE